MCACASLNSIDRLMQTVGQSRSTKTEASLPCVNNNRQRIKSGDNLIDSTMVDNFLWRSRSKSIEEKMTDLSTFGINLVGIHSNTMIGS